MGGTPFIQRDKIVFHRPYDGARYENGTLLWKQAYALCAGNSLALHSETMNETAMNVKRVTTAWLLVLLLLGGCQGEEIQKETVAPVRVEPLVVTAAVPAGTHRYSGTVEEESGTPLSFATAGTVQTVHIRLGQHVRAGQLIATLDSTSLQSSYHAARASLEQAEDAYRRMKTLHDRGSLADIKWVEVQSKVEQARSLEQLAAKSLRDARLYAPYAGVISEKSVEVGQNVLPGAPVARLAATSALKVRIAVPEAEIAGIAIGQEARMAVPALDGETFTGRVVERGITAHPLSRSYEVKIQLEGAHGALMPGMVAEVSLAAVHAGESRCVIPARLVQIDEQNRTFVWSVAHGRAHKCFITPGDYTAEGLEVLSGLHPGDVIIAKGSQKVCEGTEVAL